MARTRKLRRAFVARITRGTLVAWLCLQPQRGLRAEEPTSNPNAPLPAITGNLEADQIQQWNFHAQNTDIMQGDPSFRAQYSGPNSLDDRGEVKETVSFDLYAGVRLWQGAEAHVDGLMWQGFGLSDTRGVEGFPNGEAFRLGTRMPDAIIARLFLRQTINLGGELEKVGDDELSLAGKQDVSRLTLTLGKISVKDIFDNNSYANDPRTQFMNWALMANEAWDYPADSLGFETGFAAELNEPGWTLRSGVFQMPQVSNGMAQDAHYLKAWGAVAELERRFTFSEHSGAIRFLVYRNRAHMGSYAVTLADPDVDMDITQTRAYRYKTGYGVNAEQELAKNVGAFARLGWSDGQNEAWVFADVDRTATLGLSFKGEAWGRQGDTLGFGGAINAISSPHREFLAAGGTGILAGDGALSYGPEQIVETYYDVRLAPHVNAALDYQFVANPAYNRDRGPVSIFGVRLHWEY
jgi:high affinity Mn2+ porin